jgi:hypothetical protein
MRNIKVIVGLLYIAGSLCFLAGSVIGLVKGP